MLEGGAIIMEVSNSVGKLSTTPFFGLANWYKGYGWFITATNFDKPIDINIYRVGEEDYDYMDDKDENIIATLRLEPRLSTALSGDSYLIECKSTMAEGIYLKAESEGIGMICLVIGAYSKILPVSEGWYDPNIEHLFLHDLEDIRNKNTGERFRQFKEIENEQDKEE